MQSRARDVNAHGNSRKHMMDSVHASLRRLGTDYIDLYWVHCRDDSTPIEEILRGLDNLVSQGKVLYIGMSDTPAWQVSRANTIAELRGWTSFVGMQVKYSLLDRDVEHELLPMASAFDISVVPWDVLGSGVLTGKYSASDRPSDSRLGVDGVIRNCRGASPTQSWRLPLSSVAHLPRSLSTGCEAVSG